MAEPSPTSSATNEERIDSSPVATRTRSKTTAANAPWVDKLPSNRSSLPAPRGASSSVVQRSVDTMVAGEWLELLCNLSVRRTSVLPKTDIQYIVLALKHSFLYKGIPCTKEQFVQLVQAERVKDSDLRHSRRNQECKCDLHQYLKGSVDHFTKDTLTDLVSNASELDGQLYSGNSTNIAIRLIKHILYRAKIDGIQVQMEAKSTVSATSSKVLYVLGCGDEAMVVEGTPDFYARTKTPYFKRMLYVIIGETESEGSQLPEVQLGIMTVGQLAYGKDHTMLGAMYLKKSTLSATVYMAKVTGILNEEGTKRTVEFRPVNKPSGYCLLSEAELEGFSKTFVAVLNEVIKTNDTTASCEQLA